MCGAIGQMARDHVQALIALGRSGTARNRRLAADRFGEFVAQGDLLTRPITPAVVEGFEAHLRARGNCRNTTSFYLRNLRAILNHAGPGGDNSCLFSRVYTGIDVTVKRALRLVDIRRIVQADLTAHGLPVQTARDLFIFSLYSCGMAFIDMAFLLKTDISGASLTYRRHKTGQRISIGWGRELKLIAERHPSATRFLLPIITRDDGTERQQYTSAMMTVNRRLKIVAKAAGVDAPLSMYAARHSWATIARDNGVPLHVISRALGHTSCRTTQIYLASISDSEVTASMRKIIKLISL